MWIVTALALILGAVFMVGYVVISCLINFLERRKQPHNETRVTSVVMTVTVQQPNGDIVCGVSTLPSNSHRLHNANAEPSVVAGCIV